MKLYSTNNKDHQVSFQEALFRGLPPDNGLYMPTAIPELPSSFFEKLPGLSFQEIALEVTSALLSEEVPVEVLKSICDDAFDFEVPLVEVSPKVYALELFHGPTHAFKDFGARFMARIMGYFLEKSGEQIHILVATSGDTGSAVAQGFLGVKNIKVSILYPSGKVSPLQEKQLTTAGQNISALEVEGTFDDCQAMVKQAFLDQELSKKCGLSSANSINIARLIPQSLYYFWAYGQLQKQGLPVNFCVPSGNFGNLTGGLLAKKMGLPIKHFIAATNVNDIVPQYLENGQYEPRPSIATISNAMDVGAPSNFARMQALFGDSWEEMKAEISGYAFDDDTTQEVMVRIQKECDYPLDPHGAVGYLAIADFLQDKNEIGVFLETAHPAKFHEVVKATTGLQPVIPPKLEALLELPKESRLTPPTFEALKAYLVE
ncbi:MULTISPECIES: threonine synthase [Persicobacter]|uniref:Threonine synthase n=1 Tax=Persicobacter diffluens TaxID=981 RepID=A0AAN4VUU1_9BACT|nr:threonine synthase [Persicobacter sp. CCB-QB2]GJM59491.1 threonine synthase [Persicobacter diffluens]